mmetsp:Transcript_71/g.240  ORF Transcript_71/g.240 Transcript_71/m.240 type:complete len:168 (-) Transcript_71:1448-1951(-)
MPAVGPRSRRRMRLVGLVCVTAGVALLLLLLPHSDRIERSHTIPGPLANDSEDSAPQDRSSNPAAAAAARRRRAAELDEAAQTTQAQFCARLAESMAYLPSGAKEVSTCFWQRGAELWVFTARVAVLVGRHPSNRPQHAGCGRCYVHDLANMRAPSHKLCFELLQRL